MIELISGMMAKNALILRKKDSHPADGRKKLNVKGCY
jgi:hypothetical protein